MCTDGGGAAPRRFSLNGQTMGTRYTAIFYGPEALDVAALGAALFGAVDQVDQQMSTWKRTSALSRLNAAPAHAWVSVPAALFEVLDAGLQVGRQSNGAFDIGVGALVEAWGFGPSQQRTATPNGARPEAAPVPAWQRIELDRAGRQVRKHAAIAIDLSGIAKGYGVDRLAHCLDRVGVANYLVGINGEMRARGSKPDGDAWAVALEQPSFGVRAVAGVMALRDVAIATSGDYRRCVSIDGTRYAHTIAPALQQPVRNTLAAVSVLAPTCMLADAWATALLVLGETAGLACARAHAVDALFIVRDGEGLREVLLLDGHMQALA